MSDLENFNDAVKAAQDPDTAAADLAIIAQRHPSLRRFVAKHPNTYPGLLDWLDDLGDEGLSEAIAARRAKLAPLVPAGPPAPPAPSGPPPRSIPPASGPAPSRPASTKPPTPAATGSGRRMGILIAAGVVVLALVVVFVGKPWQWGSGASPKGPWVSVHSGADDSRFRSVEITGDGGVITVGSTSGRDGSENQALIAKYSGQGTLEWEKTYGGAGGSFISVATSKDGGFIAVGAVPGSRGSHSSDAVAVKYAKDGTLVWARILAGSDSDTFYGVAIAKDGAIIAVGMTYSTDGDWADLGIAGMGTAIAVRLSGDGVPIWAQAYGGKGTDVFTCVALAKDGSIVVGGFTDSIDGDFPTSHGDSTDAVVVRLSSDGHLQWAKTFGGSGWDQFDAVAIAPNGSIVVAGVSESPDGDFPTPHASGTDAVIARLGADGGLIWAHTYGGRESDSFFAVAVAKNGEITAVGYTHSIDGDFPISHGDFSDAVVVHCTGDGTLIWAYTFGGTDHDSFNAVAVSGKGSIAIAGTTASADGDFPTQASRAGVVVVLTKDGLLH